MRQLVELQKHADDFKKLEAELIFVFREEKDGVEALKGMKEKYKTDYTLTLDFEKKSSKAYSSESMTFDNFIIDKTGVIRAAIDGSLRERATADEIIKELKKLQSE